MVLAAVVPQADAAVRAALPGCALRFLRTLEDARREARSRSYELVLIGLHFDESRMFDLLVYLRSLDRYRNTPIVCVQDADGRLPMGAFRVVEVAVRALGGRALVDLRDPAPQLAQAREFLASLIAREPPRQRVRPLDCEPPVRLVHDAQAAGPGR